MVLKIVFFLAFAIVVSAYIREKREGVPDNNPVGVGPNLVSIINNKPGITFTARRYEKFEGLSTTQLKKYLGVLRDPVVEAADIARSKRQAENSNNGESGPVGASTTIPASFSTSNKWPQCRALFEAPWDQGNCASCWAVSTTNVIKDRRCIVNNGPSLWISAWDLLSCCKNCTVDGNGCGGGYINRAFKHYQKKGIVTGGRYGMQLGGCKPYQLTRTTKYPSSTPCSQTCQSSYTTNTYSQDKKMGGEYLVFSGNNEQVMREIMTNGPVVATFDVYQDFYQYSTGVYKHTTGAYVGGHAVKLDGWGEYNGVKYWSAQNSWGEDWGINGFFAIIRGTNDCNFESYLVTGKVNKD